MNLNFSNSLILSILLILPLSLMAQGDYLIGIEPNFNNYRMDTSDTTNGSFSLVAKSAIGTAINFGFKWDNNWLSELKVNSINASFAAPSTRTINDSDSKYTATNLELIKYKGVDFEFALAYATTPIHYLESVSATEYNLKLINFTTADLSMKLKAKSSSLYKLIWELKFGSALGSKLIGTDELKLSVKASGNIKIEFGEEIIYGLSIGTGILNYQLSTTSYENTLSFAGLYLHYYF